MDQASLFDPFDPTGYLTGDPPPYPGQMAMEDVVAEMTAAEVKAALSRRHGCNGSSGEWVCIEEAFCGFTSAGGGVDLLAIGAWQTARITGCPGSGKAHRHGNAKDFAEHDARHPVVAYEVKVSRSDFRRELYGYAPGPNTKWRTRPVPPWPRKAFFALERSHYFLFAVPKGLLRDDEIERRKRPGDAKGLWLPEEAGLVEVDGRGCTVRVPAPRRAARPLTTGETAELLRHGIDPNKGRQARERIGYLEGQVESLRERIRELGAAA